jgi:hypothetical protein
MAAIFIIRRRGIRVFALNPPEVIRVKVKAAVVALILLSVLSSGQQVIYIKSDATWKASDQAPALDWFKPEYDPLTWGYAVSGWNNNPCSKFCTKIKSCEVSCLDWMWYGSSCDNCVRFFKKTVDVPGDVKTASITISADDSYWLYVNGNFVGSDERKLGYSNAETYDIANFLNPGSNVIAIKAEDKDGFEGVVVSATIVYTDTKQVISQLESQIKSLKSQISNMTEDKKFLQGRVDYLDAELKSTVLANENLKQTLDGMKSINKSLTESLAKYKRWTTILAVILAISVVSVYVVGKRVYERYIRKRKPTLSIVPVKKGEGSKK